VRASCETLIPESDWCESDRLETHGEESTEPGSGGTYGSTGAPRPNGAGVARGGGQACIGGGGGIARGEEMSLGEGGGSSWAGASAVDGGW